MTSGVQSVQYMMQVIMLVDGGTMLAPIHIPIFSTIAIIQYTLMIGGIPFLLLKLRSDH